MRCETIIRELSVPSGTVNPSAMADHLASCSRCASWSAQNEKLQHIWDATRPAEPSHAIFETTWANALAEADAPEMIPITTSPRWRRWGLAGLVAAQAAALLIAGIAALSRAPSSSNLVADVAAEQGELDQFRVGGGTMLIVSLAGPSGTAPTVRIVDELVEEDAGTDMIAASFDILNEMESR